MLSLFFKHCASRRPLSKISYYLIYFLVNSLVKVANTCTRYLVVNVGTNSGNISCRPFRVFNTQHINTRVILRARCVKILTCQRVRPHDKQRDGSNTAKLPIFARLKPLLLLSMYVLTIRVFLICQNCDFLPTVAHTEVKPRESTHKIVLYHVGRSGTNSSNVVRWYTAIAIINVIKVNRVFPWHLNEYARRKRRKSSHFWWNAIRQLWHIDVHVYWACLCYLYNSYFLNVIFSPIWTNLTASRFDHVDYD